MPEIDRIPPALLWLLLLVGAIAAAFSVLLAAILWTSAFWLAGFRYLFKRAPRLEQAGLQDRQGGEVRLEQDAHQLNERVKELRSLLEATEIMAHTELELDEILQQTVTVLPAALQHSESSWARIDLLGQSFQAGRLGDGPALGFPIRYDGEEIGCIEVGYKERIKGEVNGYFLPEEQNLLSVLALQISHLYERKLADEQLQLAALVFDHSREMIAITDAQQRVLSVNKTFTAISGYAPEEVIGRHVRSVTSGRHDKAFYAAMWREINSNGFWRGELWNRNKSGELYTVLSAISAVRNKDGIVYRYVAVAQDISKYKQAEERIRQLAHYDLLTELPNRTLLRAHAEQLLRQAMHDGISVAFIFLDLDRFKLINDSLGSLSGDELLQEVAYRLNHVLQHSDILGRVAGDEFLIILNETGAAGAIQTSKHLLQAFEQPFVVNNHTINMTASLGIAIYPRDGRDFHDLLKNSDIAMHQAKELGRNRYHFFTPELNTAAMERFTLEGALRTALENGELELYYQPQIDLMSGDVIGVESLLRWQHPELGFISPARFIPIAEESGLIQPIGSWVLHEACRQNKAWLDTNGTGFIVAVNVSVRQFVLGDLLAEIRQALSASGLPPQLLEVEITESLLAHDMENTLAVLNEIDAMGVRIAVDDFGTGYSSLAYLKRFPLHKLKLDQSFVRDLESDADDRAIASGVVNLGHSLGLTVIAEGVENNAQLSLLKSLGCDEVQGYLYSRPLPAAKLPGWLRGHQALR